MLNREKLELFEDELCGLFPPIAQIFVIYPLRFEYLSFIKMSFRKSRQMVFEGNMASEENYGKWNDRVEPFKAIVTDKRLTKQGISIKIWVGENFGEGDLLELETSSEN